MSAHPEIRIAIVDDHLLFRAGVCDVLQEFGGFNIVAEGFCAEDAVRIANETSPDVILLDVNMPGGGLEAAAKICSEQRSTRVVLLTVYDDISIAQAALQSGVSGFILKGVTGDELATALRKINAGERHVSREVNFRLLPQNGA